MSEHTKGPWFVTGSKTKYVEARIDGGLIQEVAAVGPTAADNGYGPQQEANACLIAAAPDLLDALEQAEEWLVYAESKMDKGEDDSPNFEPAILAARAAIAKAKGEAQ